MGKRGRTGTDAAGRLGRLLPLGRRVRRYGAWPSGFTILEIIAVLVLLGILAVVAVNRLSSDVAARAEANALQAALRYAQSRAMADVYTWGLSFTSSGYTLVENNPHVTAVLPGQGGASRTMPSGVSLGWSLAAGSSIFFDWRGQPVTSTITNAGDSAPAASVTQSITVKQSGQDAVVVTVTPYTGFVP